MRRKRQAFYGPEEILDAVQDKVEKAREAGESVDYLTFVPDGEPTLDVSLGREIELLKRLEIPIAVITNGSLIWRQDVREELMAADWVSVKVDAVEEAVWRQIDRPHGSLELTSILEGALEFAKVYEGDLVTETMLVAGVNDGEGHVRKIADFLTCLQPAAAYLAIPTRPPAEKWVCAPAEVALNGAYQILSEKVERVEYLIGYEGDAFAFTGNAEEDLLSITAVHPMREDAVGAFLARAGTDWPMIHRLIGQGQLLRVFHEGREFYVRKLSQ
jgi:wyosine [tRNA(Phe)-imidazoG37] synthetase (radical SAM superfamily)